MPAKRGSEPIPDYDSQSARELRSQFGDLGRPKLRRIRRYEESHRARKTVLDELDYYLSIRGIPKPEHPRRLYNTHARHTRKRSK